LFSSTTWRFVEPYRGDKIKSRIFKFVDLFTTECCSSAQIRRGCTQFRPKLSWNTRTFLGFQITFFANCSSFLERLIKYEQKGWAPRFPYVFNYLAFLISYSSGMFAKLIGKLSCQPNQNVPKLITILFQDRITYRNISCSIKKNAGFIETKLWINYNFETNYSQMCNNLQTLPSVIIQTFIQSAIHPSIPDVTTNTTSVTAWNQTAGNCDITVPVVSTFRYIRQDQQHSCENRTFAQWQCTACRRGRISACRQTGFRMIHRMNTNYVPKFRKPTGLCNRDAVCLLWVRS
jgi:hypothetical protein